MYIIKYVDRAALNRAITTANAKIETAYTPSSWTPFAAARAAAIGVRDNLYATQAEVNTATTNLKNKMNALVARANKSALLAEINTSNGVANTGSRYTDASWNTFAAGKSQANTIYNDLNATQVQVNAALVLLQNARIGLTLRPISLAFSGSWSGQNNWSTRSGWCVLYGSGTLTISAYMNNCEVWMVGGGGGGGNSGTYSTGSGGGGGGYVISRGNGKAHGGQFQVSATSYWVNIGGGGGMGGAGGATTIFGLIASGGNSGGGNGTAMQYNNAGGAGASGGGGGTLYNADGETVAYPGIGGQNGGTGGTAGGPRGGAGGSGQGWTTTVFQENGNFWRGETYAPGGSGGSHWNFIRDYVNNNTHPWAGTSARNATANTGGGGGGGIYFTSAEGGNGTAGGSGIIVIRWYD